MKFVLDNFSQMTLGQMPGVSPALHHRFIEGFVPHYFVLADESADSNFKQKLIPPYPLVLAPERGVTQAYSNQYPTVLIPNAGSTLGKVILSTDTWHFYIEDPSQTDLGIPSGTPASNVGIDAIVFNDKILTSHPLNGSLYHGSIDATPSWTASTGTGLATGITKILEPFLDEALVTDGTGTGNPRQFVRIVDSSFAVSSGFDASTAWDIVDVRNYNDRYAALFAQPSTSPRLSSYSTCFLWNGVAGSSWDYKLTLRGHYRCSIVKDGILYAFTQLGRKILCFRLRSTSFEPVGQIRNAVISTDLNVPKTRIAVEGDFFVLLVSSSGNTTSRVPLYWNPDTGESFILQKAISSLPYRSLLIASDPSTNSTALRYFGYQQSASVGALYTFALENSNKTTLGADYNSNFIPAPYDPETHGDMPMGRIKIDRIDIEYSEAPPANTDIITLTLTTKDEYVNETYDTFSATVKDTTANSTNAAVGTKRAIIDNVGKQATEFAVDIAVTVSSATWDLIIRRIVIHYTPINQES